MQYFLTLKKLKKMFSKLITTVFSISVLAQLPFGHDVKMLYQKGDFKTILPYVKYNSVFFEDGALTKNCKEYDCSLTLCKESKRTKGNNGRLLSTTIDIQGKPIRIEPNKGSGSQTPFDNAMLAKGMEFFMDLQFTISNVNSQIVTEKVTGKQYKEYTYTATIKNLGNFDALIGDSKTIRLQHWTVPSCMDTSNKTTASRPVLQPINRTLIKPGKKLVLTNRRATHSPTALTKVLVEMIYGGDDNNPSNNFACIEN